MPTKIDGDDVIELLKWAGNARLRQCLPRPLKGYVGNHDTGCQPYIEAVDENGVHPSIVVWRDSKWYSHQYEYNDRNMTFGIQPGCEWAQPAIERTFRGLVALRAEEKINEEARKKQEMEDVESRQAAAKRHYASILGVKV